MYDELTKRLRERSVFLFPHHGESRSYDADLMHEAADAIEELQVAKCPHYIRNIHDRGNDSLCDKWHCEVKEVAPVRHGRWIDNKVAFYLGCSECGCYLEYAVDTFLDNGDHYHYCPNCGAKVDGGGE